MRYKQLDYMRRCQILAFWKGGDKQKDIAKKVGVHQSTISPELNRNIVFIRTQLGSWQYKPDYAQGFARERHRLKKKKVKLTDKIGQFIREKLQEKWNGVLIR
jgi:IS30 family transposase